MPFVSITQTQDRAADSIVREQQRTWFDNGERAVGSMSAELQSQLGHLAVHVLWQTHISIDVVDVDALHGHLRLCYGLQTVLHTMTSC